MLTLLCYLRTCVPRVQAMSDGAEQVNVTLQYCMALPRHMLQSASFPRVTHARASHDYGQSRSDDSEQVRRRGKKGERGKRGKRCFLVQLL